MLNCTRNIDIELFSHRFSLVSWLASLRFLSVKLNSDKSMCTIFQHEHTQFRYLWHWPPFPFSSLNLHTIQYFVIFFSIQILLFTLLLSNSISWFIIIRFFSTSKIRISIFNEKKAKNLKGKKVKEIERKRMKVRKETYRISLCMWWFIALAINIPTIGRSAFPCPSK